MLINIRWFFRQVKRSFAYAKYAWRGYDWDYCYSIDMFRYSLERLSKNLQNDKDKKRCEMIIELMKRVNEEYYWNKTIDEFIEKHGTFEIKYEQVQGGFTPHIVWSKATTEEENREIDLLDEQNTLLAHERQQRAEKLLWKLIEHNIKSFWN